MAVQLAAPQATPGAAGRPPAAAAGDAEAPTECSPAPKDQPAALVQPSRDSTSGRPQAQPVALRVELATKKEAQVRGQADSLPE